MNSVPVSAPAGVHFSSRKRKIRLLSGCSAAHAAFRRLVTIICLTLFLGMFPAWTCVTPAWAARAGTPLNEAMIMVLPFQAQGSADNAKTADEITWMIAQRLNAKGLLVMPHDEMLRALGQQHGGEELDMAAARRILARSRANVALYGIYTQKGSSFSVDGRLVSSNPAEAPKAIRANQPDVSNLLFAVEDMAAQVNSEMRKNSVISRVEVRGTKALDADVVLLRINTRPGDPVDPLALDRELKRIWDLGYFSDIVLELEQSQTGIVLVYNVKEKPRISKITIKNAKAVNEADIRVAMSTQVGSVLNDKTMVTDLQAINELYRKKGHYLAASTYRLEHKTDNTAELIIDIEEGRQLFIKKIVLNGVKSFSERSVKGELALSERWLFSIFTDSGVLKEEMLERDVFSINAFYMNRGFMDVKVSPPKVNYEEDGITITYEVNEGPRYRVGGVSFAGELIDSDAVLSGLTEMSAAARKKEYFNLSVLQDDIKALSAYYAEYGYAFAAVSPQTKKGGTAADPSVSVVYVIEKRQKVYVRNIIIEGNHQTRDNVILREMRLVDGDAFNGKKLNRSIQRLNRLGHFEKAESELIPTSNPEETDLKIKLAERSTGAIIGGVGYSTYSKFGVSASIQENNLWGKGYGLGFQTFFSSMRTSYDVSFSNPRVNDSNLALGLNLYRWEDDYTDYNRDTMGGGIRLGYPVGEYSSVGIGYRAEFYKLYDFDSGVTQTLRQYEGKRTASVLSLYLTRDTTDHMRPSSGTIVQLAAEYGGGLMGGDDAFVKLMPEYQFYQAITENSVAHLKLRGGILFESDRDNPPPVFERFWIGGIDSIRGYRSRDIVPRDPYSADRIGGDRMAYANLEYIYQVSKDIGINLVPFFDIGVNVDSTQKFEWKKAQKKSAGLELRWRSPMGDLRFSWGYPFDKGWYDEKLTSRFEFSIGNFF